jgi:hypothetical protein
MVGPGMIQRIQAQCNTCNGKKKIIENKCNNCIGCGTTNIDKQFVLVIEPGSSNGDNKILRSGDKANVILEFLIKPEYVKNGMRLIFREGKVKAVGKIVL